MCTMLTAVLLLALAAGGPVLAADLSAADQRAIREWQDKILQRARAPEPGPAPEWVKRLPDGIAHLLVEKHLYKEGQVWGLAKRFPDSKLPYEEEGTAIFLNTVREYKLLDRIPGYNEEARQKMIRFWQAWQDPKTGHFVDPRDPARTVNEKYVMGILSWLGVRPLYPWTFTTPAPTKKDGRAPERPRLILAADAPARPYAHLDPTLFLQRTKDDPDWEQGGWGVGSHTGAMAMELLDAIDAGRDDLVAPLEQGLRRMLSHQGPDGLWGPTKAPLACRLGGALKVTLRLYFYRGLVVPRTRELADALVTHQLNGGFFKENGDTCIPQNTAILIAYCLEASDYRRADLLKAMESVAEDLKAYVNPDGGVAARRGGPSGVDMVFLAGVGLVGDYLNWQGSPIANPHAYYRRGAGYPHRLMLTPDGGVKVEKATGLLPGT